MRVALDLDRVSQLQLLKVYFWLRQFTDNIEVFISSVDDDGGEHYHVIAYDLPETSESFFYELRAALGDDPARIWIDQHYKGKVKQVLFNRRVPMETLKPRYESRVWSILWKPFWMRLPAKKLCFSGKF
ncbi:MAG: hypothetical protein QXZ68_04695 [Candidatus Bathyarchaeia archaeon]